MAYKDPYGLFVTGASSGSCLCWVCCPQQPELKAEHCWVLPDLQDLHHADPDCH